MKINKILAISAILLSGAAFNACTDKVDYEPTAAEKNAQVYFSTTTPTTVDIEFNQSSFEVPVFRGKADGDLTVAIKATDDNNIFSVPSSVSFANGQKEAKIVITYDFNALQPNANYPITLEIQGEDASLYGKSVITLNVCYAPWTEWEKVDGQGLCDYTYAQFFSGVDPSLPIQVRQSIVNPNEYEYCISDWCYGVDLHIYYDANTNKCTIPLTYIGYDHDSYGPVYISDTYTYYLENYGQYSEDVVNDNWPGFTLPSYIVKDEGKFYLDVVYSVDAGFFGYGYEYVQLAGYAYYNIELSDLGHYIDPKGNEYQLIYSSKSEDVASYKVTVYEGTLSDEQLEAAKDQIEADASLELYTEDRYNTFKLTDGNYTVVAVGYNSSREVACVNAIGIKYESAGNKEPDDSDKWQSVGYCDFEDGWLLPGFGYDPMEMPWPVEVLRHKENPGLIALFNIYQNEDSPFTEMNVNTAPTKVVINCENPECVYVTPQFSGFDDGDYKEGIGTFIIGDIPGYFVEVGGYDPEVIIQAGKNDSYLEDGIIVIESPIFGGALTNDEFGYNWNDPYPVVIYLPDGAAAMRRHMSTRHYDKFVLDKIVKGTKKVNIKAAKSKINKNGKSVKKFNKLQTL